MNNTDIMIRPLKPSDIANIMQLHRELGWNPAFKADGSTLNDTFTVTLAATMTNTPTRNWSLLSFMN